MEIKELVEIIDKWEKEINKCNFLGEIYLKEPELVSIASSLGQGKNRKDIGKRRFAIALLITGVNCAYHYYDEDGFWVHFFKILNMQNTSGNINSLGLKIETQMREFGLLRFRREGPFRFVGSLLEHCGVSRRYIPSFARILKELKAEYDWQSFLELGFQEYTNKIAPISSSEYLKNFLLDREGWRFTQNVINLLFYYEQGLLSMDNLKEIPGFQPGFWAEFIRIFFREKELKKDYPEKKSPFLKPKVKFFPERKCLGLVFPSNGYVEKIIKPKIIGKWEYPVTFFETSAHFGKEYIGKVKKAQGEMIWEIPGWKPDGSPVIFDFRDGFLPRSKKISPGEYFILVPEGNEFFCNVKKEIGEVFIPGYQKYFAYQIIVEKDDFIPGYCIEKEEKQFLLEWADEKTRFKYASTGVDVFSEKLPEIILPDISVVTNNQVGIFFETNWGSGRIKNKEDLKSFKEKAERKAPAWGSIWLTALGRGNIEGNIQSISQLDFILLPSFTINFEDKLYSFDEKIKISSIGSYHDLILEKGEIDRHGNWVIPPNIEKIKGEMNFKTLSIEFTVPISRAGVYKKDGKQVRFLLKEELEAEERIWVSGYPGMTCNLLVEKGTEGEIFLDFKQISFLPVQTERVIKEMGNTGVGITEIHLKTNSGTKLRTGAIIIDFDLIKRKIYSKEICSTSVYSSKNPENLIKLSEIIVRGGREKVNIDTISRLPEKVKKWINELITCSVFFDRRVFTVNGKEIKGMELINDNDEIGILLKSLSTDNIIHGNKNKLKEDDIQKLPEVKRWKDEAKKFLEKSDLKLEDLLEEWKEDIVCFKIPLKSRIAKEQGGRELTSAWEKYFFGPKYEEAISFLSQFRGPNLLEGLAFLLKITLMIRLGRLKTAKGIKFPELPEYLWDLHEKLMMIIKILEEENFEGISDGRRIEKNLPFRKEEKKLFEITDKIPWGIDEIKEKNRNSEDWLMLCILREISTDDEEKKFFNHKLKMMRKNLPKTPEWKIIKNL